MNRKTLFTHDDILRKYSDMVYKLALSQCKNPTHADDIFQDVFMRYVKSKVAFESDEHIKAWLIRVTINCCKKLWSSAWFRNTVPLEENTIFTIQEKSDVFYTVLELPTKYRIVIHLYYYEDLSVRDMSTILHLKESTITSQLCRARNLLKEKLKGEGTYDFI